MFKLWCERGIISRYNWQRSQILVNPCGNPDVIEPHRWCGDKNALFIISVAAAQLVCSQTTFVCAHAIYSELFSCLKTLFWQLITSKENFPLIGRRLRKWTEASHETAEFLQCELLTVITTLGKCLSLTSLFSARPVHKSASQV